MWSTARFKLAFAKKSANASRNTRTPQHQVSCLNLYVLLYTLFCSNDNSSLLMLGINATHAGSQKRKHILPIAGISSSLVNSITGAPTAGKAGEERLDVLLR